MTRICKKCNKELPLDLFCKNKNCANGYEYTCKSCKNAAARDRYQRKKATLKTEEPIPENVGNKICARCLRELPLSCFNIELKGKDGHRNICKECDNVRIRRRREINKINKTITWWNRRANSLNNRGEKKLPDKITGQQLQELYEIQAHKCFYCHRTIEDDFEVDHMIPISMGGTNTIDNISLCCKDCNRLKWTRTHEEFLTFLQTYITCFTKSR